MENQPKISDGEAVLLIAFAITADILNLIPFFNILVTIVTLFGFQLYFIMKGVVGGYNLAGNLIDIIPGLNFLPMVTAGVVATIIHDRITAKKPKLQKYKYGGF